MQGPTLIAGVSAELALTISAGLAAHEWTRMDTCKKTQKKFPNYVRPCPFMSANPPARITCALPPRVPVPVANGHERTRTDADGHERTQTDINGHERTQTDSNGHERTRTDWYTQK